MNRIETLSKSISGSDPAVIPYVTGGFPNSDTFIRNLAQLRAIAPAVEVGIPFSDPMADGATIQESSRLALAAGASLDQILKSIETGASEGSPLVIMSYLNPLLAYGLDELMPRLGAVGVAALVIPDLPLEEAAEVRERAHSESIGLVQMVTPLTSPERLATLVGSSDGFVYAVTMTGTTGGEIAAGDHLASYLDRVSELSEVPVVAGFGVRTSRQVRELSSHCDGVIVGSALVEVISAGNDPIDFYRELTS